MYDLYPSDMAGLDRALLEPAVRQRARTDHLGGKAALSRISTRYRLLPRTLIGGFARHVMMNGRSEICLTQFFARTLRPGTHNAPERDRPALPLDRATVPTARQGKDRRPDVTTAAA